MWVTSYAVMLTAKRSAGVMLRYDICGEYCTQAMKIARKGIHPGFETHPRCQQKSETGKSVT